MVIKQFIISNMRYRALNAKQQVFIKEYLVDKNATRAAIVAGYSTKTAYSIGHENLKKPEIQKAIQKGLKDQAKRADLSADRVLQALAQIAFADFWEGEDLSQKLRALELLGKHFGLFKNKVELTDRKNSSGGRVKVILYNPENGRPIS